MLEESVRHIPVLADAVLELLDLQRGQIVVDATTGVRSHARLFAEKVGPEGRVIVWTATQEMLALAQRAVGVPALAGCGERRLKAELQQPQITFLQGNFEDLPEILQKLQVDRVDAILADLGFCSDQMADPQRGLSFQQDGPLDMRLDRTHGETAGALVQRLRENELAEYFLAIRRGKIQPAAVARKIVEVRKVAPLTTTARWPTWCVAVFLALTGSVTPIDQATRVFQALRIAVNDELGALERLLKVLPDCLKPGGRAAIISFHSLEDRLVKRAFRRRETWEDLTKKPRIAAELEICHNPHSQCQVALARIPVREPSR